MPEVNSQDIEQHSNLLVVLTRGIRIASLIIVMQLLVSGCATHQSPHSIQIEAPITTLEYSLVGQHGGFWGTSAVVTKDAVWLVVPGHADIYKIDPLQKKVVAAIQVGAKLNRNFFHLHSALVESGNAIWVAAENTVIRIDPKSGKVIARIPFDTGEPFIVSASDNAVWVGTLGSLLRWVRPYTVSKIDPQTNGVITTLPQEFSMRSARVTADTNAIWFLDGWADTLSRIEPTSGNVDASIALGRLSYPHWPVAIGEGAIWFANTREGKIIRINPGANQVAVTIPLPYTDDAPPDEFRGPPRFAEGAVWVASGYSGFIVGPTIVSAIDPNTNQVVATLKARTYVAGSFGLGHGALWVPVIEDAGSGMERLLLEVYRLPNRKSAER